MVTWGYLNVVMVTHELIVIVVPGSAEEQAKAMESIQGLIVKHGGKVIGSRSMGERTLAYIINKHRVGTYYLLDLELPNDKVNTIAEAFNLAPGVIRAMIVRKEHDMVTAAPAAISQGASTTPSPAPVVAPVVPPPAVESVPTQPLTTEQKKKLDIDLGL